MKPIDILDALSDLPEEYTAFAVRSETAQTASEVQSKTSTSQGGIVMNKNQKVKIGKSNFRITRFGIAAAVAVCIGLNAALISGISRMKQNSGTFTPAAAPEIDVQHPQYMELVDAMPTGIIVKIKNDSEDDLAYNPQYIVMQDGNKVADTELPPGHIYFQSPIRPGESIQTLAFAQLPAGRYTLVNLAEDGESEGVLGHIDFEISADFDSMVWIPNVSGMDYDEAKALLEEKGVNAEMKFVNHSNDSYTNQVVNMLIQPYKTEKTEDVEKGYLHADGKGYWVNEGDVITLTVNLGNNADTGDTEVMPSDTDAAETVTVPDFTGMDWETAKQAAKDAGFLPSKMLCEPDGKLPGTVANQIPSAGEKVTDGSILVMYVAKKDGEQELAMEFSVTEPHKGSYYYCVRNEAKEIIGITYPFKMNMEDGSMTDYLYPDCSEENTKVEAFLVNYVTKQEAVIGSYILHPETGTYDTITEDIEAAFRQVE